MKIAVRQAKNSFSELGDLANKGKRIVVTKHGKPWFDLVPHTPKHRKTQPLPRVKPVNSLSSAMAPVPPEDIAGWR